MRIHGFRGTGAVARMVVRAVHDRSGRRMMRVLVAGAAGFIVSLPGTAPAHHSVAMFDATTEVVLKGTVTTMEWANPHVWIRLNVADEAGNVVEWGVEASNPLDLGRKGWTKNTFKKGDEVTITIHPAKSDRPFGSFIRATLPDGSVLGEPEEEEEAAPAK